MGAGTVRSGISDEMPDNFLVLLSGVLGCATTFTLNRIKASQNKRQFFTLKV